MPPAICILLQQFLEAVSAVSVPNKEEIAAHNVLLLGAIGLTGDVAGMGNRDSECFIRLSTFGIGSRVKSVFLLDNTPGLAVGFNEVAPWLMLVSGRLKCCFLESP